MPGMSLHTGISAGASYNPMTPPAAISPTARSTISQAAYGVNGTGAGTGPKTAALGTVLIGYASIAGLIYLWWSLPR
jgi:hypothetical protein